jgi:hypothetical protein
MSCILFAVAALGLIFAPVSLYRLGPFLVAAFMMVCLQQLLAKQVMPEVDASIADTPAITEKAENQEETVVPEEKLKQS